MDERLVDELLVAFVSFTDALCRGYHSEGISNIGELPLPEDARFHLQRMVDAARPLFAYWMEDRDDLPCVYCVQWFDFIDAEGNIGGISGHETAVPIMPDYPVRALSSKNHAECLSAVHKMMEEYDAER